MSCAPDRHGARVSEQPTFFHGKRVCQWPQLLEARAWKQLRFRVLRTDRAEIEQHDARAAEPPEQHELGFVSSADERVIARHECNVRLRLGDEKLRRASAHYVERARFGACRCEPVGRFTQLRAAIEVGAGKKIWAMAIGIHATIVAARL
jgi:hypothetical protein